MAGESFSCFLDGGGFLLMLVVGFLDKFFEFFIEAPLCFVPLVFLHQLR